jgi:hypothetical protein
MRTTPFSTDVHEMSHAYETDFYGWAMEQAALLRAGRLAAADIGNIAEEIESMGRGEKCELVNRLAVLLLHLLKWRFQPGFRSPSWSSIIREHRIRLRNHLDDNPSLKSKLDEALAQAYELALIGAARETGLPESDFPKSSPYRVEQAIDDACWPE